MDVSIFSGSPRLELQLLFLQLSVSVAELSPIEDGRHLRFDLRVSLFLEAVGVD